jgi:hypothetical protein
MLTGKRVFHLQPFQECPVQRRRRRETSDVCERRLMKFDNGSSDLEFLT